MVETLAVEWGPYGIQINGLVPGLFPHEDMTTDIRGNVDRRSEKDLLQPALRTGRLRELGWAATLPHVTVRPLHLRPHPGRGRCQLAAADTAQPPDGRRPRPDGPRALCRLTSGLASPG
ncbi:hypothetical protein ACU686_10290 [Yinghuangia aomiensis]